MTRKKYPKVAVLLAAYNGKNWIEEQLNTILSQKNVDVRIFISVDISDDGTFELCNNLAKGNCAITVLPYGDAFGGAARNFYRLIQDVDFSTFEYISLADQDDIWLPYKLFQAVGVLNSENAEGYSSDVVAFWANGRRKLVKKSYPQKKMDHYFESAGPGCTYVLKLDSAQKLKKFIREEWDSVDKIKSHDWLIYAFFRSKNMRWYIDNQALMLYRQHENNQVGSNFGFSAYLKRLKMIKSGWYRSEVDMIFHLTHKAHIKDLGLSKIFLLRHVYQFRRKNRDVLILLFMILFGIY